MSTLLLVGESDAFYHYFESLLTQSFCRMTANGVGALAFFKRLAPKVVVIDKMTVGPNPWELSKIIDFGSQATTNFWLFSDTENTLLAARAKWYGFKGVILPQDSLKQLKAQLKDNAE